MEKGKVIVIDAKTVNTEKLKGALETMKKEIKFCKENLNEKTVDKKVNLLSGQVGGYLQAVVDFGLVDKETAVKIFHKVFKKRR